jgi:CSLREA domain-containing protein
VLVRDLARPLRRLVPVLVLVGLTVSLAMPTVARAAVYTVNSFEDQGDETPGSDECKTSVSTCTLRAAIEEANFSSATKDTVKFDATMFKGLTGNTITLTSSLTAIKAPLLIDGDAGGQCDTSAGVEGPCVEVDGPGAGSALTVENADEVEIEGLAITSTGGTAVNVIDSSTGFQARDNWIGVKLDGSAGANNKGIFLDPDSDNAVIGGLAAAARNVISNNSLEGLDAEGAGCGGRPGELPGSGAQWVDAGGKRQGHRGHGFDLRQRFLRR